MQDLFKKVLCMLIKDKMSVGDVERLLNSASKYNDDCMMAVVENLLNKLDSSNNDDSDEFIIELSDDDIVDEYTYDDELIRFALENNAEVINTGFDLYKDVRDEIRNDVANQLLSEIEAEKILAGLG